MAGSRPDAIGRAHPTRAEWEQHKSTIVGLYRKWPFKEVQAVMSDRYGFHASKRMYDTRFRQWGVSKILKSSEKDRLISLIRQSSQGEPDIKLSAENLKKLNRHEKSLRRQQRKKARSETECSKGSPQKQHEAPVSDSTRSTSNRESKLSTMSPSPKNNTPEEQSEKLPLIITCDEEPSSCTSSSPKPTVLTPASATPLSSSSAIERPQPRSAPVELIPNPPVFETQENVIFNVTSYYSSRLDELGEGNIGGDVLDIGATRESRRFWSNIKNGIYLWRIAAPSTGFVDTNRRSYAAFDLANQLASKALQTEPMNFICEILSSLSPTRLEVYLPMRNQILRWLADRAALLFRPAHPIRILCQELQKDLPNSFISSKALFALHEVFNQKLGQEHLSTFRLMTIIITQMRRSHDAAEVRSALKFAEGNAELAELCHGRDSHIARSARVEQAHVLTRLGSHGHALSLRNEIVAEQRSHYDWEEPVGWREDGLAAHTMEDIAEYYVRFRDIPAAIEWLKRAKEIALKVWSEESFSTLHISDKLEKLERGELDGQVVDTNL